MGNYDDQEKLIREVPELYSPTVPSRESRLEKPILHGWPRDSVFDLVIRKLSIQRPLNRQEINSSTPELPGIYLLA